MMRKFFTYDRVCEYFNRHYDISTERMILRTAYSFTSTIIGVYLIATWGPGTLLAWLGLALCLLNSPIENFLLYRKVLIVLSKITHVGLLKPGHLVEFDPFVRGGHFPRYVTLNSAELSDQLDKMQKKPSAEWEWGQLPTNPHRRVTTEPLLVLEREKFWVMRPRIKVLYEDKIYYVNPRELRRVK